MTQLNDDYDEQLSRVEVFFSNRKFYSNVFNAICTYVRKRSIYRDIVSVLDSESSELLKREIGTESDFEIQEKNNPKKKIKLLKLYVTFVIKKKDNELIPYYEDKELCKMFIEYNKYMPEEELICCNVSGTQMVSCKKHPPIFVTDKLISANNKMFYEGRFDKNSVRGLYHIGGESSQKIHSVLKFLMKNENYSWSLGENSKIIAWFPSDLLLSSPQFMNDAVFENFRECIKSDVNLLLGGSRTKRIVQSITGYRDVNDLTIDKYLCILIIESNSKGRTTVKYFNSFLKSQIDESIQRWYLELSTPYWSYQLKKSIFKAPSIGQLVNFIFGRVNKENKVQTEETVISSKFIISDDTIRKNMLQKFIYFILLGERIPYDYIRRATLNLLNRYAYKECWDEALWRGSSIIKKFKMEQGVLSINSKGEIRMDESKGFLYGRLLAIYEKIELDAIKVSQGNKAQTNVEVYWNMIRIDPLRMVNILQDKILPYKVMLRKAGRASWVNQKEILLENIYQEIWNIEKNQSLKSKRILDDDIILGYYIQKRENYTKFDEAEVDSEDKSTEKDNI